MAAARSESRFLIVYPSGFFIGCPRPSASTRASKVGLLLPHNLRQFFRQVIRRADTF